MDDAREENEQEAVELLRPNPALYQHLDLDWRPFFALYSISLTSAEEERLAAALSAAVAKIAPAIREPRLLVLYFGKPPAYGHQTNTGTDWYIADMSQDPIATCAGAKIYLDARRLAAMASSPYDTAVVCILEELVHAWMNVRDEAIAKMATAALYGGLVTMDGRYLSAEQFVRGLAQDARVEGNG